MINQEPWGLSTNFGLDSAMVTRVLLDGNIYDKLSEDARTRKLLAILATDRRAAAVLYDVVEGMPARLAGS